MLLLLVLLVMILLLLGGERLAGVWVAGGIKMASLGVVTTLSESVVGVAKGVVNGVWGKVWYGVWYGVGVAYVEGGCGVLWGAEGGDGGW